MSYRNEYDKTLGSDSDAMQRTTLAVAKQAKTVFDESTATQGHLERVTFAVSVANSPESYARSFLIAITAQQPANYQDATLDTQIAALWNLFAGVGV